MTQNSIFGALQAAMQNPVQILQRLGLDQRALQNPQAAIQGLMNSGRMTQQQYNQLYQQAQQLQSDPAVAGLLSRLFGKA